MRANWRRHLSVMAAASTLVLVVAGCTPEADPAPVAPTPSASAVAPTESPDAPPQLIVGGDAKENRPHFDHVISSHISAGGDLSSGGIAAALVAAGWAAADIERTPDATPLGNQADAITVAVRAGDDCLIGQWKGDYTSIIAPALADGRCLVGTPLRAG